MEKIVVLTKRDEWSEKAGRLAQIVFGDRQQFAPIGKRLGSREAVGRRIAIALSHSFRRGLSPGEYWQPRRCRSIFIRPRAIIREPAAIIFASMREHRTTAPPVTI